MIRILLRLEGFLVFIACLSAYAFLHASWSLFAVLWLVPDVGMIGFLMNTKLGAITYNLTHTFLAAGLLTLIGYVLNHPLILSLGIIWISHIGLDRFMGYGLKYPTHFKDTHIQHL